MSAGLPQSVAHHSLLEIAAALQQQEIETTPTGAQYYKAALGLVDCVRYVDQGIAFQPDGREIVAPQDDEILLLPTSVSLCGTDLALIEKAQHGQLPAETQGKVVGHEAAGFIVGKGKNVQDLRLGEYVCLDSHYACGRSDHHHFNDCVMSGKSCDGIAGGIRGALSETSQRDIPYDGYWSRVIAVPASAVPLELPIETAQHLKAPSTLESLGNIYMIVGQLKTCGVLAAPQETLCIVSGLGATGYPMAAVATHYGFHVAGINPSAGKREFAMKQGVCAETYATLAEAATLLPNFKHVAIVVTADHPQAHEDALAFLESATVPGKKVAILFGLFADPKLPLSHVPAEFAALPQRDFVFSRKSFTSPKGVEVYGVCGRDITAWQLLMNDLKPTADGAAPKLATMLNEAQLQVPGSEPLAAIAETLNQGATAVEKLLSEHQALKLVANLTK